LPSAAIRTVYFTAVPLFPDTNGGALCCRNHVHRLARDPTVDLVVCSTGPPDHGVLNREALEASDVEYRFLPFAAPSSRRPLRSWARRHWPFLYENDALAHPEIDGLFAAELRELDPDAVIVDYVPSASFVPSVYRRRSPPLVTITLNREGDYYRRLQRDRTLPPGSSASTVAVWRATRFERWVYEHSDAVVALAAGDLPRGPGRPRLREVISPVFDPHPTRWRDTGSRAVLFVGNIAHPPNRPALDWLCTRLAPALAQRSVRLRVVGASADVVPEAWRRQNVDFLGTGDAQTVVRELTTTGLFLAPFADTFGAKIKLVDCLSHATPFAATQDALRGLPFISAVPLLDLARPDEGAELVDDLLSRRDPLLSLSRRIGRERDKFLEEQTHTWGKLLTAVTRADRGRVGG
jgi:hypothetical protein